jgi:hypothetical protein
VIPRGPDSMAGVRACCAEITTLAGTASVLPLRRPRGRTDVTTAALSRQARAEGWDPGIVIKSETMTGHGRPEITKRIGHRLPAQSTALGRLWHENGLSIVLVVLFVISMAGQTVTGWFAYNAEQREHGEPTATLAEYLRTGHFGEATFENWESEFLQMAFYVLLTAFLYQRGSSESKRPDVVELVDLDPRDSPVKEDAPWPVRRGGPILSVYENSLSLLFGVLFVASFALHAWSGALQYNADQIAHGQAPVSVANFISGAQFWFESFQNWQSEFLSLAAMVVFTIFLRQRGSPESKPVHAPTWDTGA